METHKQIQPSFLLGVFCYDKYPQQKNVLAKENAYPDLKELKDRIEKNKDGPHHRPYSTNKKKVMAYQALFLSFSLLFFTLVGLIYYKTTNWTCSLYFGNCMLVKTIICTLSLVLSLSALWAALIMRTEKEAVHHLAKRAKKRLQQIFSRRKAEQGIGSLFLFGEDFNKMRLLKIIRKEFEEKIEDKLAEVLLLINRIKQTKEVDSEIKEDLYNQAILEFHDQLHAVIQTV